jgi:hypothetical protein
MSDPPCSDQAEVKQIGYVAVSLIRCSLIHRTDVRAESNPTLNNIDSNLTMKVPEFPASKNAGHDVKTSCRNAAFAEHRHIGECVQDRADSFARRSYGIKHTPQRCEVSQPIQQNSI